LLLAAVACAGPLHAVFEQDHQAGEGLCYSRACLKLGLLSDVPISLGSLFCLFSLRTHTGSHGLAKCYSWLSSYAFRYEFQAVWDRLCHWDLVASILVWMLILAERLRGTGVLQCAWEGNLNALVVLHVLSFASSTLLLMSLCFCMTFICHALTQIIDTFCTSLVSDDSLEGAVMKWNQAAAVLRQSSEAIQACVFVMQTTIILMFCLAVFDVHRSAQEDSGDVAMLVPSLLLVIGMSQVFFKAAAVTDRCNRVPSLINSLSFGDDEIDTERQYVVEYVRNSAAGFYIFELRLTSDMTLKGAHVLCVGVFALFTQIVW
jgi:hypothetical protein